MKKAFLIFGAALLLSFSAASCLGAGETAKTADPGPSTEAAVEEAQRGETEPSPSPGAAGDKAALEFKNHEENITFRFDTVDIEEIP